MKLENLKLSEQNRSLLFLVGEKEREIHKKGETIRTFEDYKESMSVDLYEEINALDVSVVHSEKRRIERTP